MNMPKLKVEVLCLFLFANACGGPSFQDGAPSPQDIAVGPDSPDSSDTSETEASSSADAGSPLGDTGPRSTLPDVSSETTDSGSSSDGEAPDASDATPKCSCVQGTMGATCDNNFCVVFCEEMNYVVATCGSL